MVVTAYPTNNAGPSPDEHPGEHLKADGPEARPHHGAVRILRTPEELSEAIVRAQEFERRNGDVIRNRAQRYMDVLAAPLHPAAREPSHPGGPEA